MFDKDRIAKLKKGVFIVNNARGAIMDAQAVADACSNGQIAGNSFLNNRLTYCDTLLSRMQSSSYLSCIIHLFLFPFSFSTQTFLPLIFIRPLAFSITIDEKRKGHLNVKAATERGRNIRGRQSFLSYFIIGII